MRSIGVVEHWVALHGCGAVSAWAVFEGLTGRAGIGPPSVQKRNENRPQENRGGLVFYYDSDIRPSWSRQWPATPLFFHRSAR
jgi:hypothetical protein